MSARGGELVATDKPTIVSKPFLDTTVVKDSQSDGCFPDPPWTDESNWGDVFCQTDDPLDQLVTSETGPRRWGRWFSKYTGCERKVMDSSVVEAADLVRTWATISILLLPVD